MSLLVLRLTFVKLGELELTVILLSTIGGCEHAKKSNCNVLLHK